MAGFRSFLAKWLGGAGAVPPPPAGGFRSLLAKWAGGAGAVPTTPAGGFKSLLAFWTGGATAVTPAAEETPQPGPSGGSTHDLPWITAKPEPHAVRGSLRLTFRLRISARGHVEPVAVRGRLRLALSPRLALRGRVEPVSARGSLALVFQPSITLRGRVDNSLPEQIRDEDELLLLI